jgi:hypothetical protein
MGDAMPGPRAGQQVDVIRGQVSGPDNAPIENAHVTATSVQGMTQDANGGPRISITINPLPVVGPLPTKERAPHLEGVAPVLFAEPCCRLSSRCAPSVSRAT